jgi:membrane fusion protein, multidrug efflux system
VTGFAVPRPPGRRVLVTVVVLVAGAAGAAFLLRDRTGDEPPPPPPVPILVRSVGEVERSAHFEVSGEVEARRTVNVGFQVPGVVARVLVDEGQTVREGELLAELDDEEYRLNLGLADAQVELATDAYRRARQLFDDAGVPEAELVRAEVAVRRAGLQREIAQKHVNDTRLLAPTSGLLARRGIHPGEQAGPGVPVFTIVAIDPAQIRVGVPEAEIGAVRVGQSVTIRVPALPGTEVDGRVEVVGVLADPVSRTYPVRIGLPNPGGRLRPGMIVEAYIAQERTLLRITIPGDAVVPDHEGTPMVYVYEPGEGRVYSRRIRLGALEGTDLEVLDGLSGGELLVVGGQHRLRDGVRVEPTYETADVEGGEARSP